MSQVPCEGVPRRHFLLFHRHGFLRRRHSRTFLQDSHPILHPSDIQLHPLVSTAFQTGALSQA